MAAYMLHKDLIEKRIKKYFSEFFVRSNLQVELSVKTKTFFYGILTIQNALRKQQIQRENKIEILLTYWDKMIGILIQSKNKAYKYKLNSEFIHELTIVKPWIKYACLK